MRPPGTRGAVFTRRVSLVGVALGLVLLSAAPALASTRYADPNGDASGAATCPLMDPCDLETAIEDASVNGGDDVLLASGTYALANEVTVGDAIDVIGAGAFSSVLNSSAKFALRVPVSGAKVAGLGILATSSEGGATAFSLGGDSVGERLSVRTTLGGAACQLDAQATLRDSVCANHNPSGFAAINVDSVFGTVDATLRNVTGFAAGSVSVGLSVFADINTATISAGNTVFLTPTGGGADVYVSGDGVAALATLDHSSYAAAEAGPAGTVSPAGSGTNIVAAPLFANAAGGDFHQLAGSPTIDKGSAAASGLGAKDIDRQARTQGTQPDIGADEFVPAAKPPAAQPKKPKKKCKKKRKGKGAAAAKKGCKKKRK